MNYGLSLKQAIACCWVVTTAIWLDGLIFKVIRDKGMLKTKICYRDTEPHVPQKSACKGGLCTTGNFLWFWLI